MLEILRARSGVPTARLDGRYLHSPHDPVREASRAVAELVRRDPPCVLLLGFGLGYHAEALLAGAGSTTLVIYEPDAELLHELRRARDVSRLDTSPRVVWCVTPQELRAALVAHAAAGFDVFTLPGRLAAPSDAFSLARDEMSAFRSRVEINTNTLRRFGRLWVRNLCRNTGAISVGRPVTVLAGALAGVPGLLLAAGPGLDQVLDDLPRLAERTVVVAVDTAVAVCRSAGVTPDIAVVVDPQYWNTRHLDGVQPASTLLVSESSAHPAVFRHFAHPPLFCSSLFPLGRAVESVIGAMGPLGTGGSVSTTAWDLLRFAGCNPVFSAGLDLGFPGGRTHFRGSFFETMALAAGNRLQPAESTLFRYVVSGGPFVVPAEPDGSVVTDRRMEIYRRWFADQLAAPDAPDTFTLSRGGARVERLRHASTERVLALPPLDSRTRERLSAVSALPEQESRKRRDVISRHLVDLADGLHSLKETATRALRHLGSITGQYERTGEADFTPLQSVDEEIAGHGARAVVSFLMQGAISGIRSGYGSGNIPEQLDASRALYGELSESAAYHAECIRRYAAENDSS